jgi:Reverse transcriptase (RNA-dependent DNA polymerase)
VALTTHSEEGFQYKLKTGAVFVDLTAAYDTVWREGLLLKFGQTILCSKLFALMNNMLSNRFFRVFLGDQCSRWRRLNNRPQGSVLAPILFNLYFSDIPSTTSKLFQYADDIAMTFQSSSFEECETSSESDLGNPANLKFVYFILGPTMQTEDSKYNLTTLMFNIRNIWVLLWIELQHSKLI